MYSNVYYIYKKWRVKILGESNGEKMYDKLEEMVKSYNEQHSRHRGKAFLQKFRNHTISIGH